MVAMALSTFGIAAGAKPHEAYLVTEIMYHINTNAWQYKNHVLYCQDTAKTCTGRNTASTAKLQYTIANTGRSSSTFLIVQVS
jgi:hypothetical protein